MEFDMPMINNIEDALDTVARELESHLELLSDDNIHYLFTLKLHVLSC